MPWCVYWSHSATGLSWTLIPPMCLIHYWSRNKRGISVNTSATKGYWVTSRETLTNWKPPSGWLRNKSKSKLGNDQRLLCFSRAGLSSVDVLHFKCYLNIFQPNIALPIMKLKSYHWWAVAEKPSKSCCCLFYFHCPSKALPLGKTNSCWNKCVNCQRPSFRENLSKTLLKSARNHAIWWRNTLIKIINGGYVIRVLSQPINNKDRRWLTNEPVSTYFYAVLCFYLNWRRPVILMGAIVITAMAP